MTDRKDNTEPKFDPEVYEYEQTHFKPQFIQERYSINRFKLNIGLSKMEHKPIAKTKSLIDKALLLAEKNIAVSEEDIKDLHREMYFDKEKKLIEKMDESAKEANWVAGIEKSQPRGDID